MHLLTLKSQNEEGQVVRSKDKSNSRTSLITDEVRVYKGGSWKDRAIGLIQLKEDIFPIYCNRSIGLEVQCLDSDLK